MDAEDGVILDCRGLLCPLPMIRVQDRVADLAPGARLEAICTDPGVLQDLPAWCRVNGHIVLATGNRENEYFVVMHVGHTCE